MPQGASSISLSKLKKTKNTGSGGAWLRKKAIPPKKASALKKHKEDRKFSAEIGAKIEHTMAARAGILTSSKKSIFKSAASKK
ncbi:hypothetical protein MDAP_002147 [Mitosporidium daphniae]